MPNANYNKGARREREFIKRLYAAGALWAARTAGSHSIIDVVAILQDGSCSLYQIKSGNAKMTPLERDAFIAFARLVSDHTKVYSVEWKDRQEPVIQRV